MWIRRVGLLAIFTVVLSACPTATAEVVRSNDARGDAEHGRRLDITHLRLTNADRALIVNVSFARAARGDLVVFLAARHTKRADVARIINYHRPHHEDLVVLDTREGTVECLGLRASWDHDADTARIRVPSSCFRGGDYGAVRTRILTEQIIDTDIAPNGKPTSEDNPPGRWLWTEWASRG